MRISRKQNIGPIGLDIGARQIKAVQLSGNLTDKLQVEAGSIAYHSDGELSELPDADQLPGRPKIEAAAKFDRLEPEQPFSTEEVKRLKKVLSRSGFIGHEIVVSMPANKTFSSVLDIPPVRNEENLIQIAKGELSRSHRLEQDQVSFDYWELPRPIRSTQTVPVMATCCKHEDVNQLIEVLESGGLRVSGVDTQGWATARSCTPIINQMPGIVAVVDLAWEIASFDLIHHGTVIYQRTLEKCANKTMFEAIEAEHGIPRSVVDWLLGKVGVADHEGACDSDVQLFNKFRNLVEDHYSMVGQELSLSMNYALHQYPSAPLQALLITGGGAEMLGATDYLSAIVDARVYNVEFNHIGQSTQLESEILRSSVFNVAAGLAQYTKEAA
ncbi:pilus assembly protein PilM [Poriferisphaera sp. WC338]|uniref:pilus assembly protein PilM n=1 Tax=Poriferisphaera sp. WC338 TaxID=3425129 RepID=UPI003D813BD1